MLTTSVPSGCSWSSSPPTPKRICCLLDPTSNGRPFGGVSRILDVLRRDGLLSAQDRDGLTRVADGDLGAGRLDGDRFVAGTRGCRTDRLGIVA